MQKNKRKLPQHRPVSPSEIRADSDAFKQIKTITTPIVPDRQAKKRWYGTHQFYTRRAWNIVQTYVTNFCPTTDATVLDPFGGSGITAVEAAILGRRGIAYDVNPFAVFYARCAGLYYPHPLDAKKSELLPKFAAIVEMFTKLYPKTKLSEAKYVQEAREYGIPEEKLLDHRVNLRTYQLHTPKQLFDLALLKHCILNTKYKTPFTKDLLLFVFSAVVSKCNRTFVSAKGRKASRGGARIFSSYALNLPPNPVELEVFPEFQNKFKKLLQAKQELFLELKGKDPGPGLVLGACAAQDLDTKLKPESVDYIFTDPPYGKLIPYLDLSSFFCDWLDLPITSQIRKKDIIENSSMHRTKEFYYAEMSKAFEKMFTVLKENRWLTLVYAHKNTEYWDAMITACQDAGFEFVNAVYEKPDVVWSLTKKKNKATTFSGELYLNFRKSSSTKGKLLSMFKKDFPALIRNTVELAIVHNEGCATIEDIYAEVVPILARYGLLGKLRREKIDLKEYVEEDFNWNSKRNGYELPSDRKLSSFIPIEERVEFYVRDFLISKKTSGEMALFDEVISNVLPNLVNGDIPSRESILDVLKKIAARDAHGNWMLSEDEDGQIELPIAVATCVPKHLPKTSAHNLQLWKLLFIGNKAGLSTYMGKNEQRDRALVDSGIPFLTTLPVSSKDVSTNKKIDQIDCLWLRSNEIEYAFEIEESTTILSGFERFSHLMDLAPKVSSKRNLIIVIPKRRINKLKDVFINSTYIGAPLYFENKVRILFSEDLDKLFESCKDHYFKLTLLEKSLKRIDELK